MLVPLAGSARQIGVSDRWKVGRRPATAHSRGGRDRTLCSLIFEANVTSCCARTRLGLQEVQCRRGWLGQTARKSVFVRNLVRAADRKSRGFCSLRRPLSGTPKIAARLPGDTAFGFLPSCHAKAAVCAREIIPGHCAAVTHANCPCQGRTAPLAHSLCKAACFSQSRPFSKQIAQHVSMEVEGEWTRMVI